MVRKQRVNPIPREALEEIGFEWHTDPDGSPYVADEIVLISEEETEGYYEAANELYDMFVQAAQYVIDNDLFHEIGVPFNLVPLIKMSWESDVHWHIYGRFDFAGGIDGQPIKLLEFNADTPTSVFETAIIQWALLKHNGMDESKQFNALYEGLVDNFKRLVTLQEDVSGFEESYEGWKILFSSARESVEDENTVRFLQKTAHDAGWTTGFCYMDEVGFDPAYGVFDEDKVPYEFWFKLFPWEEIASSEPQLLMQLEDMVRNQKAIFLNPAYTVLFHAKGIMKVLKELFPESPYLLETSYQPLEGRQQVQKRTLSREGENVRIVSPDGQTVAENGGAYGAVKSIYQEFVQLPQDREGNYYQAGVFYTFEGAGLGFRRGGMILDNRSKFVAHAVV